MDMKNKQPKAHCSICSRPIFDSVNPEKIITCARCVQILLMATRENKISYRNQLLEREDIEGARSVEAFIIPEEDTATQATIATFKTTSLLRGSDKLLHRSKRFLNRLQKP